MCSLFYCILALAAAVQLASQVHGSSDALFSPPPFPDILFAFHQSLTASSSLREMLSDIATEQSTSSCACRHGFTSYANRSQFVALVTDGFAGDNNDGGYAVQCLDVSSQPVVSSAKQLTVKPEAAEMVEHRRVLVITLTTGLLVALAIGIIVILLRKYPSVLAAVCPAAPGQTVHHRRVTILRQRSDCQQMVVDVAPECHTQNSTPMSDHVPTVICCQCSVSAFLNCCNSSSSSGTCIESSSPQSAEWHSLSDTTGNGMLSFS